MEVYVQPYPGPGPVVPVSIGGGDDVMWSPDGTHLFYRLGDQLMSVAFNPGDPAQIGSATAVLEGRHSALPSTGRQDDVARDGRFLMIDGRLLMTSYADETPAHYSFEGTGTLVGLLAGIVSHKVASPRGTARVVTCRLRRVA